MLRIRETSLSEKIWIFLLIIVFAVFLYIGTRFDKNEATVINGQSLELNDNWFLHDENGIVSAVSLPHAIRPGETKELYIQTGLNSSYSGRMLDLTVNNAYVTVVLNGNTIYGDDLKAKEGNTKQGQQKNLVYLPEFDNTGDLKISFAPVDDSSSILIRSASITRADQAIIRQIKESLLQLFCCTILLICGTMMAVIEVIRKKSEWQEENLLKLAFFAFTLLIYCVMKTRLPVMFFGNSPLFENVQKMALSAAPMALFFYRYKENTGINAILDKILLSLSILCLTIESASCIIPALTFDTQPLACILLLIIALKSLVFALMIRGYMWGLEIAWLILLMGFGVMGIEDAVNPNSLPNGLSTAIVTLSFLMSAVWQTSRLVSDYRAVVEESEKEAIRANEAKGAFLANMSHEIRTPINAILGMDEMILREAEDKEIRSYATDISSASHTLLSIINDILDLSKIESGKMDIVPVDYDTAGMFKDTINMIRPKALDKGLKFNINISPEIPSRLYGDDVRIRQVLTNLLSNAVKYTDQGSIELKVTWKSTQNKTGKMLCEVRDTGIGIKKEDIPKLFDKYSRFDEALHNHTEGTGLGMNITMHMLSLMDSRLKVESEYGKGSVFRFVIKQGIVDPTALGDFEEKLKVSQDTNEYAGTFEAPEAKVLVVDDNTMNRKVFKTLLKDTEMQVKEAGSGKECLSLVSKERFDLIFMDHMMPDMDGIETLRRMHGLKKNKNADTPVIILTANAIVGAKEEYLNAGFDGYLSKPIIPEKLETVFLDMLPPELIKQAKKKKVKKKTVKNSLPDIPGVDKDYLSLHFPEEEMQLSALKEFLRGARPLFDKLDSLYNALPGSKDDYRIHVHGMKSAASSIGQMVLFGMAKALEEEARSGHTDTVLALHKPFKDAWVSFTKDLSKTLGVTPTKKKKMDPGSVSKSLISLQKALNDNDIDKADIIMENLSSYRFEGNLGVLYNGLLSAVNDIDTERAEGYIKKLKRALNARTDSNSH